MKTLSLLSAIERVRPEVGNLIQHIQERGSAAGSSDLVGFIVNEIGEPIISLRTIVRAMGVLDDFSKTKNLWTEADTRTTHAYHLVEYAVREYSRSSWGKLPGEPGGPLERLPVSDLRSGLDGDPDDSGRHHKEHGGEPC